MNTSIISIIVPIYGVEKYIEKCAISLFEQDYDNIEYIFIDDCSKDNSIKILEETIKKYPQLKQKITIIHHKINRGLAAARNTGINQAHGKYVMHVDSDDWLEKNCLSSIIEYAESTKADIVNFGVFIENQNKTEIKIQSVHNKNKSSILKLLISDTNTFSHSVWGKIYKLSLYKDYNITAIEGINYCEDYVVTPKLYYRAHKLETINRPFYHYRMDNPSSYMNTIKESSISQAIKASIDITNFFNNVNGGCQYLNSIIMFRMNICNKIAKSGYKIKNLVSKDFFITPYKNPILKFLCFLYSRLIFTKAQYIAFLISKIYKTILFKISD